MSELKAFNCVDSDLQEFCEPRLVYLKSEADEVIAEKDAEIARLKALAKEPSLSNRVCRKCGKEGTLMYMPAVEDNHTFWDLYNNKGIDYVFSIRCAHCGEVAFVTKQAHDYELKTKELKTKPQIGTSAAWRWRSGVSRNQTTTLSLPDMEKMPRKTAESLSGIPSGTSVGRHLPRNSNQTQPPTRAKEKIMEMIETKHDLLTNKYTKVLEEAEYKYNVPHTFKVIKAEEETSEEHKGENLVLAEIHFQEGPIKECGVNGVCNEDLLVMVIRRLEGFQNSEFKCRENACAITKLEEALLWLRKRTMGLENRGVEGTHKV